MKKCAFTLVEVAIVLIVIGLVLGGILVGQDLVKAAQTRASMAQFDSFETAAVTFRQKYNCIPGDCKDAVSLGFSSECNLLDATCGNNKISGVSGSLSEEQMARESLDFWLHLSEAKLTNGTYTGYDAAFAKQAALAGEAFPALKLKETTVIVARSISDYYRGAGPNYFLTHGAFELNSGPLPGTPYDTLLPIDNFRLDSKMDDGMPDSGKVLLMNPEAGYGLESDILPARLDISLYAYGPAGATSNFCATNETPAQYNILNITPYWDYPGHTATTHCSIAVRAGF